MDRKAVQQNSVQLHDAGLIHDIRSHLTTIKLCSDSFGSINNHSEIREILASAIIEIETLLQSYNSQEPYTSDLVEFAPKDLVQDIVKLRSNDPANKGIRISWQSDSSNLRLHKLAYQRVLSNLLNNALESLRACNKTNLSITIIATTCLTTRQHTFIIEDNGLGISSHLLPQIFSPGFSTKLTRHNQGLGLYIVKQLVENELNGTISVKSKPNVKTAFTVTIPLH
jgi:signal transduction histidine kinase